MGQRRVLYINTLVIQFPHTCQGYPGYFQEPHWNSMGLLEISRVTLSYVVNISGQSGCMMWVFIVVENVMSLFLCWSWGVVWGVARNLINRWLCLLMIYQNQGWGLLNQLERGAVITRSAGQFSPKYSQNTPHSSPVRVSYGLYFGGSDSDWYWYSAPAYAVMCVISCYSRLRYNGTQL